MDDLELRIAKLQLGPDDVLVVKCERPLTADAVMSIRERFRHIVGRNVLVIDSTIDLSVITKSQLEKLAA